MIRKIYLMIACTALSLGTYSAYSAKTKCTSYNNFGTKPTRAICKKTCKELTQAEPAKYGGYSHVKTGDNFYVHANGSYYCYCCDTA